MKEKEYSNLFHQVFGDYLGLDFSPSKHPKMVSEIAKDYNINGVDLNCIYYLYKREITDAVETVNVRTEVEETLTVLEKIKSLFQVNSYAQRVYKEIDKKIITGVRSLKEHLEGTYSKSTRNVASIRNESLSELTNLTIQYLIKNDRMSKLHARIIIAKLIDDIDDSIFSGDLDNKAESIRKYWQQRK